MLVHNSFVSDELSSLGIITLDDSKCSKAELLDQIDDGNALLYQLYGIAALHVLPSMAPAWAASRKK